MRREHIHGLVGALAGPELWYSVRVLLLWSWNELPQNPVAHGSLRAIEVQLGPVVRRLEQRTKETLQCRTRYSAS